MKREAGDDAEVLKMMRREPHTKANEHFLRRFSHISQPALSKPLAGMQQRSNRLARLATMNANAPRGAPSAGGPGLPEPEQSARSLLPEMPLNKTNTLWSMSQSSAAPTDQRRVPARPNVSVGLLSARRPAGELPGPLLRDARQLSSIPERHAAQSPTQSGSEEMSSNSAVTSQLQSLRGVLAEI